VGRALLGGESRNLANRRPFLNIEDIEHFEATAEGPGEGRRRAWGEEGDTRGAYFLGPPSARPFSPVPSKSSQAPDFRRPSTKLVVVSQPRPQWTTAPGLAAYLGVDQRTVRNWIASGALQASQVQSRHYTDTAPRKTRRGGWRIFEAELVRFLTLLRAGVAPVRLPRSLWRR
jgi:hypothetical protein